MHSNQHKQEEFQLDSEFQEVLDSKQYSFKEPIGQGGSATCFLVESNIYKEPFVIKRVPTEKGTSSFTRELEALQQLDAPEIINLYDFVVKEKYCYIFLEYCPSGSLNDYVHKYRPFSGKTLLSVCKSLLKCVDVIHSNKIAHCDIKPANALIDKFGRIKLADFGIAFKYDESSNTVQRAGTMLYMAPEVMTSSQYNPYMADVWSLGVTFYYLGMGKVPWSASNVNDLKLAIKNGKTHFSTRYPNQNLLRLISTMLIVDVKLRPTIKDLLAHPIFANIPPATLNQTMSLSKLPMLQVPQERNLHSRINSYGSDNDLSPLSGRSSRFSLPPVQTLSMINASHSFSKRKGIGRPSFITAGTPKPSSKSPIAPSSLMSFIEDNHGQ